MSVSSALPSAYTPFFLVLLDDFPLLLREHMSVGVVVLL